MLAARFASVRPAERFARRARRLGLFSIALVALGLLVGFDRPVQAQGGTRVAPSQGYIMSFDGYYAGEFRDAFKRFSDEARGSIKNGPNLWIDSICYQTMVGECYYQNGDLEQALFHYDRALELYVSFADWMMRVDFAPAIRPRQGANRVAIPWGNSARTAPVGVFPDRVLTMQGEINNNDKIQKGGVVQAAVKYPLNPNEIVRCTALALRRRYELLGPLAPAQQLTGDLIVALSRRPCPPNHWSEAWVDVQLGLAYLSADKVVQAKASLQRGLLAGGQYDHPLTSTALLELGKIAMREQDFPAAQTLLYEAACAAFRSEDMGMPDVIDEAFRYGLAVHLHVDEKTPYAPLLACADWARIKRLKHLEASALIGAAENQTTLGKLVDAEGLLKRAQVTVGLRDMRQARVGAHWNYVNALMSFQKGQIRQGETLLAESLKYYGRASRWNFQTNLADQQFLKGVIKGHGAMNIYAYLLRDPTALDWTFDPMEPLSNLLAPMARSFENYFVLALDQEAKETAFEIADMAKRRRFFAAQSMGGRLLSLRWVLDAPDTSLPQAAALERQKLLGRYPTYGPLQQEAARLRTELMNLPLAIEDDKSAPARQQAALTEKLAEVSGAQEQLLRVMAIRREPASMLFPRRRSLPELRSKLQPGQAMLTFFHTSRHTYAFLFDEKQYNQWQTGEPLAVQRAVADLLRDMGNIEGNKPLRVEDLADTKWKRRAATFLELLLKGVKGSGPGSGAYTEWIIVPDGPLWYVPFEALQLEADGNYESMLSKIRIHYAPLASLGVPDKQARRVSLRTAIVAGRLFPGADEAIAKDQAQRLADDVPGAALLRKPLPGASSVFSAAFDQLVVYDEILTDSGPYLWSPARIDEGSPGSTLDAWLGLPWHGPEMVALPAYHTIAENSLKKPGDAPGQEIFHAVTGLLATGAQTVLISRWRTGGQTSFDLVREFAKEYPYVAASDAWQRSVLLATEQPLEYDREPRVLKSTREPPKADHPFFWAPYMLIDNGAAPEKADTPADKPDPNDPNAAADAKALAEEQAKEEAEKKAPDKDEAAKEEAPAEEKDLPKGDPAEPVEETPVGDTQKKAPTKKSPTKKDPATKKRPTKKR